MKVYKYPIPARDEDGDVFIRLPKNHQILHVGLDPAGVACIWAKVGGDLDSESCVDLFIASTGEEIPDQYRNYAGTYKQELFVQHVFFA